MTFLEWPSEGRSSFLRHAMLVALSFVCVKTSIKVSSCLYMSCERMPVQTANFGTLANIKRQNDNN